MALDFDVDDGPSFQELVQSGRRDVMKGRTMAQCWSELADQHPFFKDIAKEGRLRGETLGVVLAAVEGISKVVKRSEAAGVSRGAEAETAESTCSPSPTVHDVSDGSACSTDTLLRVSDAYVRLYSSTPVPTREQWVAALREALGAAARTAASSTSEGTSALVAASPSPSSSSSTTSSVERYVAKLQGTVQSVTQELADKDDDSGEGEDGGFAEEELKELMRCCMAAGRRVARSPSLSKADAKIVREMIKALQDFVGSSTLEW